MKKNIHLIILFLSAILIACSDNDDIIDNPPSSFTVWSGNSINFEKSDGADPNLESNQDRITDNVWITRGNDGRQIYNIAKENISDKDTSPIGTEWAVGSVDDIESLSFNDFRSAVGSPKDVVGKNLVVHLIEDDVYVSVTFTSWSSGQKGGFAYSRSTQN
tara:strand:- start:279 stop:761 length:483 start_codon:yes stop_codon:yes gene_type:complete